MKARVAGQGTKSWTDPHGGQYTFVSDASAGVTFDRLSANGRYTDKMLFTFETSGSSCKITGCSESQGMSGGDQSTNLCNLWNLVCTTKDKCCHVDHDLGALTYSVSSKSSGATSQQSVCLGGSGGSGGGTVEKQASCPTKTTPTIPTKPKPTGGSGGSGGDMNHTMTADKTVTKKPAAGGSGGDVGKTSGSTVSSSALSLNHCLLTIVSFGIVLSLSLRL